MRNCHANFKLFTQFLSIFSLVGSFTFFIIGLAFALAVGGHRLLGISDLVRRQQMEKVSNVQ